MKKTVKKPRRKPAKAQERSLSEIIGSLKNDWVIGNLQIDAEVFQNVFSLRAAMRDAWRTNPYMGKYAEQLAANIFGESGIMLRSKVLETEDRVVYADAEKWALIQHERRIHRLQEWAERKTGTRIERYRAYRLAESLERSKPDDIMRGAAMIEVGAPDVFANQRIQNGWAEWQRAEFCDVRGRRNYNALRQLRLWSSARDGGHFIRLIKDTRANRFGFTLQQVNDEWCDHFYNTTLANGNVVRMGIEYETTSWGIGKPLRYHFIRRIPRDWQTGGRYAGSNSYAQRDAIPAEEIIHYARFMDTESTRPAPWGISVLGKVRQLDQYEIASVVAARAEACKTGWLYSDIMPEGGVIGTPTDDSIRNAANSITIEPGGLYGLPYGVKFQANDPKHPSGNFTNFRQGMGQATCAGLPGADYNVIFNDLNMSFSSGRIGRLDTNEVSKMLQRWDIDTAERPIFEAWLEMALITGAIDLPFTKQKFKKFNKPEFQGRRWRSIDPIKEAQASALRIANKLSSRSRECADEGIDFVGNAIDLAEEDMLLESLGLRQETTAQDPLPPEKDMEEEAEDEDADLPEVEAHAEGAKNGNPVNGKRLAKKARVALRL